MKNTNKYYSIEEAKEQLHLVSEELKELSKSYGCGKRHSDSQNLFKIIRKSNNPTISHRTKGGYRIGVSDSYKYLKLMLTKCYLMSIILQDKNKVNKRG